MVQVIAKAADGFSAGDIVNKRVRQFQSWSLMPFAAVVGSVYPAAYMRGSRETFGLFPGEMNFPRCVSDAASFLLRMETEYCNIPVFATNNFAFPAPPILKAPSLNSSPKH